MGLFPVNYLLAGSSIHLLIYTIKKASNELSDSQSPGAQLGNDCLVKSDQRLAVQGLEITASCSRPGAHKQQLDESFIRVGPKT